MQGHAWRQADRWRDRGRALRLRAQQTGTFLRVRGHDALRRPPGPQRAGRLQLDGLQASLEILRDRFGVPHIFAANEADALFGLGFVQAQDRYWQLEFYRRVGSGRLAEVAGPSALAVDRFMRHVGLHHAAAAAWEATPAELQAGLQPYASGVQAGFEATPLPLEIRLLNYRPEPWRPQDSVLWSKLVAFLLSPAWEAQITRARVVEAVGLEALLAVDPGYPRDGPVQMPPGVPYGQLSAAIVEGYGEVVRRTGLGGAGASNNWVVDSRHSAAGHALLACDPHLAGFTPPLPYFAHLHCPEFTAAGAGLPGMPGIVWGLNRRIAWGATAGLASTQDVFVEEFDADGRLYRTPDGWAEVELREERIAVRGHPSETVPVRLTRHGPLISPEIAGLPYALALRSTCLDARHSGAAMLALLRAATPDDFRAAVAGLHEYNLTVGYADVDGRVGLQVGGAIPRRRPGQGWLPAPGWDSAFDWQGLIPPEELPHQFDPPGGRLWSANNPPQPVSQLPYAGEFLDSYRATRIGEVLAAEERHTPAAARALQVDLLSLSMRRLRDHLLRIEPAGADERALLDRLRAWDGVMAPTSVAAAVVAATHCRLLDAVLRAKLGDAVPIYLGQPHPLSGLNVIAARTASLLAGLLDAAPADWFGPLGGAVDGRAVWTAALTRAFRDGCALLRERLGDDPQRWTWGRCHRLTLRHALGDAQPLARLFNRGPYPLGGDLNTVCQTGPLSIDPFTPVSNIPVLRLIIELTQPPRAEFVLAGAQADRRDDPGTVDLLADWRHGRTHPLWMERRAVEEDGARTLQLRP